MRTICCVYVDRTYASSLWQKNLVENTEQADYIWRRCRVSEREDPDQLLTEETWDEIREVFRDRDLSTGCVECLRSHAMTPRMLATLDFMSYRKLVQSTSTQGDTMVSIKVLNDWGRAFLEGLPWQRSYLLLRCTSHSFPFYPSTSHHPHPKHYSDTSDGNERTSVCGDLFQQWVARVAINRQGNFASYLDSVILKTISHLSKIKDAGSCDVSYSTMEEIKTQMKSNMESYSLQPPISLLRNCIKRLVEKELLHQEKKAVRTYRLRDYTPAPSSATLMQEIFTEAMLDLQQSTFGPGHTLHSILRQIRSKHADFECSLDLLQKYIDQQVEDDTVLAETQDAYSCTSKHPRPMTEIGNAYSLENSVNLRGETDSMHLKIRKLFDTCVLHSIFHQHPALFCSRLPSAYRCECQNL